MNLKELQMPEQSPEVMERVSFIRSQFEQGINPDLCIGYHGTSIYALCEGIRTGYLTGSHPLNNDFTDPQTRDLFLYPLLRHKKQVPVDIDCVPEEEAWKLASGYARDVSFAHAFLSALDITIDASTTEKSFMARSMYFYTSPEDDDTIEFFEKKFGINLKGNQSLRETLEREARYAEVPIEFFISLGSDRTSILQAKQIAHEYKGIMFGLHPDALTDFTVLPGDKKEGDIRLRSTTGIDIRYIRGCNVFGQIEEDIINSWGQ